MTLFGRIGCVAALLLAMVSAVAAQTYPKATGYVNDFAHLLTKEQGASLNQELVDFEKKTTLELAVVTVPSLGGDSIEHFTQALANEWGVGKKGENNGIVFLVAPTERTMRIEIASGARALFPNAAADRVRDNAVLPRFRAGDMPGGIVDGTHAIIRTVEQALSSGGTEARSEVQNAQAASDGCDCFWVLYIVGGIALVGGGFFAVLAFFERRADRNFVIVKKEGVAKDLEKAEELATTDGVTDDSRKTIARLKKELAPIQALTPETRGVNWNKSRTTLCQIRDSIDNTMFQLKREIAFAKKARKEGPKLLKELPAHLEAIKMKIAKGKHSKAAERKLAEAEKKLEEARSSSSDDSTMTWVAIYTILLIVASNISDAESSHAYDNGGSLASGRENNFGSRRSSSDDNRSSDFGFGGNSGFGGGGNFGGGGGTTGTW